MFWGYKPTQSIFRPTGLGTFADSVDFRRYDDLRRHTNSSQNTDSASTCTLLVMLNVAELVRSMGHRQGKELLNIT